MKQHSTAVLLAHSFLSFLGFGHFYTGKNGLGILKYLATFFLFFLTGLLFLQHEQHVFPNWLLVILVILLVLTFLGNLVWYYWDLFRLFYGYPMDKNHHVIRGSEVRNRAIFLWLFFTTGVSGLHHFYLRNTVRGIIEFSLFYLSLLFFGIGLLAVKVKMILFLIGILFFLVLYGFLIFDLVQFLIYKMPMNGGKQVEGRDLTWSADNPRSFNTALLLNLWGGLWGLDRYYLGYKVLALLKFFTVGGLLLWNILDSILIYTGSIKDVEGKPLR